MSMYRDFLFLVTLAAAATPALGQQAATALRPANISAQGAALIPDFPGIWGHYSFPGFEPPRSGPGPLLNKSRRRQSFDDNGLPFRGTNVPLVSNNTQLVGDYGNPILKPAAAEVVKKHGEIELNHARPYDSPRGVASLLTQHPAQGVERPLTRVTTLGHCTASCGARLW
jgi:hypothetical protein